MNRQLSHIAYLLVLLLIPVAAFAQDRPNWTPDAETLGWARVILQSPELPASPTETPVLTGVFLSEPDDRVTRVLRRAERLREDKEWVDAIAAYQILIDEEIQSDVPAAEDVYIPVDEYCRRRLLSLPDDAVRAYRTLHDAEAARLFDAALRSNSPEKLMAVARQYPLATVAATAMRHAADLWFGKGNFAQALEAYRMLPLMIRPGDSVDFRIEMLMLKTAAAMRASGDETAGAVLDAVREVAGLDEDGRRLRGLAETVAAIPSPEKPAAFGGTFGGSNDRAVTAERVMLPGRLRWHEQRQDEIAHDPVPRQVAQARRIPDMICEPIAVDGTLYHRTETTVTASDLLTGRPLWTFRELAQDRGGRGIPRAHLGRMRGGSLFLTADTKRLYTNLFYVTFDQHRQVSRFKLVALNIHPNDGPLMEWERGGEAELDEEISSLSFTSAPVVSDGKLYVGAMKESGEELYLCSFDAATGELLWKTFICIGRANMNFRYRSGNGVAEMVAEKDGVVYLATNIGVVAAAEAQTGKSCGNPCTTCPPCSSSWHTTSISSVQTIRRSYTMASYSFCRQILNIFMLSMHEPDSVCGVTR